MKRQITADRLEIRRLRYLEGISIGKLAEVTGLGLRTLKEIESTGMGTEATIRALAQKLPCPEGSAALKPVLLAGHRIADFRKQQKWTPQQLAKETVKLHQSLGEQAPVSKKRIRELEESAASPAMHHEWRLISVALGCAPQTLLIEVPTVGKALVVKESEITKWIDRSIKDLIAAQNPMTGAFPALPWSSAQAIVGLLSFPEKATAYRQEICLGLSFLDKSRLPDRPKPGLFNEDEGWALHHHIPRPIPLLDITCWCVMAQLLAWRHQLWGDADRNKRKKSLISEIRFIISRQYKAAGQPQAGGFCPTKELHFENVRTYTTSMALWTLSAAVDVLTLQQKDELYSSVADAIRDGIAWLLGNHDSRHGWVPTPIRQDPDKYLGLTAHVLYVLVEILRQFPSMWPALLESKLRKTEAVFLDDLATRIDQLSVAGRQSNESVDVHDTYLVGTSAMLEPMTFLWWPWTLALIKRLGQRADYARGPRHVRLESLRHRVLSVNDLTSIRGRHYYDIPLVGEALYALGLSE